jgi:hypothetical protein
MSNCGFPKAVAVRGEVEGILEQHVLDGYTRCGAAEALPLRVTTTPSEASLSASSPALEFSSDAVALTAFGRSSSVCEHLRLGGCARVEEANAVLPVAASATCIADIAFRALDATALEIAEGSNAKVSFTRPECATISEE